MENERLNQQMNFILEVDKMKNIYRQTYVLHENRRENDAEHSWHLAMMAFILSEHSNEKIDLLKVIKMVLIHDIVEIDAGDTYCYDEKGYEDKNERETAAAERIFGILPPDQRDEIYALWQEFEAADTPESKFAAALDRAQPMTLNYKKDGISWAEHGVTLEQIKKRNLLINGGSSALWNYTSDFLEEAKERGILAEK
ncbi:MAG: HD domain-containing protein [Oscillospiraceae bacterium]